jgi:hypothetical protein
MQSRCRLPWVFFVSASRWQRPISSAVRALLIIRRPLLRFVGNHGSLHFVGEPVEVLMKAVEHFSLGGVSPKIAD